jgi:hypothetical protein
VVLDKELRSISEKIGGFINTWLTNKDDFECRSFYGESFSLVLLEELGILDSKIKRKLIDSYQKIDKGDSQFHWEFNNYALLNYISRSKDEEVSKFIFPLKFKNTPVTNWTLLRSNARLLAKQEESIAIKEAINKIKNFQLESGLIIDQKHDKSFQYHCFSIAMIGEIYELTKKDVFYKSFINGVNFIRNFILSNGDTTYVGRGQKQSFGYGTLVYILCLAYKLTLDKSILNDIKVITELLSRYQQEDGSFPLVLNGIEQSIPEKINMEDRNYVGWYPYNNYFDYLPFMAYFVLKGSKALVNLNIDSLDTKKKRPYIDQNFIKVNNNKYEAVVSKTGGYWTNDLPIPYIVYEGEAVTPCYGGEQFQQSLYTTKGIPLPYCKLLNKSIRWRSVSFLKDGTLTILSPLGIMRRKFVFNEDSIKVHTKVISPFKFVHLYLFHSKTEHNRPNELVIKGLKINSDNKLEQKEIQYSVDGELMLFEDTGTDSNIEFIFEN